MWAGQHRHLLVLVLVLSSSWCCPAAPAAAAVDPRSHLRRLFDALDKDHDGQLRQQELKQYIGGLAPEYSSSKLDKAVEGAIGRLDSPDQGLGVDWTELEQHLHTILQDVQVADWVIHGLGLPQYADAFRSNAITALDLPMLVNDGRHLLQTELQVHSRLHQHKLLRAMQRLLLGLGSPPGPVDLLSCSISGNNIVAAQHTTAAAGSVHGRAGAGAAAPAAVVCVWKPPADPGQPVMHKYLLQRLDHSAPAAAWQTVADLQDSSSARFRNVPPQPGVYQYRLAAWNVYGRSPWALSADVTVSASQIAGEAGAAAAQGAAEAAASGHAVRAVALELAQPVQASARQAGSGGSMAQLDGLVVKQPQQAEASQQLQHPQNLLAAGRCGGDAAVADYAAPSAGVQGSMDELCGGTQYNPEHQSPSSVVWLVGYSPDQDIQHSTPRSAAGRAAQQDLAASVRAAAAAAAVEAGKHSSAAVGGGKSSNRKPANAATLAAVLGSAWQSSMGGWVRAAVNSFLLLVVPICVRLLPLHVLARSAHLLAWLLQFLPGPLRQRLLLHTHPQVQQQSGRPDGSGGLQAHSSIGNSGSNAVVPRQLIGQAGSPAASALTAAVVATGRSLPHLDGAVTSTLDVPSTAIQQWDDHSSTQHVQHLGLLGSSAAAPSAAAAAASPDARSARRGLFPRSVSDFDLVRRGLSATPASPTGRGISSLSLSHSPGSAAAQSVSARLALPLAASTRSPVRVMSHSAGGVSVEARQLPAAARAAGDLQAPLVAGAAARGARVTAEVLSGEHPGGCSSVLVSQAPVWSDGLSQEQLFADLALDDATASTAAAAEEDERDLQYALYCGHSGNKLPDNKCCSFPGCQQQFGLRHWKATLQRHYCGRCQHVFCLQHTAYSPHGTNGTCGVQSRCLCIDCFYEYTPEYQSFLASRNTLVGKRSRSGPPAAAMAAMAAAAAAGGASGSSEGGGASGAGGRAGRVLSRLVPSSFGSSSSGSGAPAASAGAKTQQHAQLLQQTASSAAPCEASQAAAGGQAATAAAAAGEVQTEAHQETEQALQMLVPPVRQRSLGSGSTCTPVAACSSGLKSRMLWGRGLTKALGVVRFKHAGEHMQEGRGSTAAAPGSG